MDYNIRVCDSGRRMSNVLDEIVDGLEPWSGMLASRDRILIGGALSDGGSAFDWLKDSLLPAESFATVESEFVSDLGSDSR